MRVPSFKPVRRLLVLALALGALASCNKGVHKSLGEPAMWHVSDADSDVYIFGSFHLLPNGVDWQKPDIKSAFDKSVLLVLETDTRPSNAVELTDLVEKYGIAPAGQTLRSQMTPDQRASFEKQCAVLHLDPARFDAFQPWYAATALTVAEAQSKGLASDKGVESTLITDASQEKKPIAFLETLEEQIRFLAGLPPDTQMQMLTATLDEMKSADAEIESMQKAWANGDTGAMSKLFDKSINDVPSLHQVLITDRNKRWADEIAKLMAGAGTVFIAVGAGHLVGDDSVIALLRQRGFKVEGP